MHFGQHRTAPVSHSTAVARHDTLQTRNSLSGLLALPISVAVVGASWSRHLVKHVRSSLSQRLDVYTTVHRERDALANLSDQQLRDIGLTRSDAYHESRRTYLDVPPGRLASRQRSK